MILGLTPLGIATKPPTFAPQKDARCIALWDWSSAANTVVSNRATVVRSLRNAADTLVLATNGTVPATNGALVNTGAIGGRVAGSFDGSTTAYQNTTIAIPAVDHAHPQFWYLIMRGNTSGSDFNTVCCAGQGSGFVDPSISLHSGAGIIGRGQGSTNTVTTGWATGTPKRAVMSFNGDSSDYMQWGAAQTAGAFGGRTAQNGFSVGARGDLVGVTYAACDIAVIGLFTGVAATGGLLAKIDSYYSALFTGWSGMVS